MPAIDLDLLLSSATAGGPSALSSATPLQPAAGPQAAVAPAKYVTQRGSDATYVYDTRFIDGEPLRTVLIDSSQSQSNRIEQALDLAVLDGNDVLSRVPRVRVTYDRDGSTEQYTDWTLPHRAFDAHIRAGSIDGLPTTDHPRYRAARDAAPLDASALFALSPISLLLGAWDASRKARQGRWPSALTGEVIGVVADQGAPTSALTKGGARVDPVGMQTLLDGPTLHALADAQRGELSSGTYNDIVGKAKKLKAGDTTSASALGFGGIPPTLAQLGGVSCRGITRARVLSFATLRQIRFGAGPKGDAACRAVLAALAIDGIVRADAELYLRAHCHLVESGPSVTLVDRRNGHHESVELPTVDEADALLRDALAQATEDAGIDWHGQILDVVGNPAIVAGRQDETREDG